MQTATITADPKGARRRILLPALVTITLLILAACGGAEPSSSGDEPSGIADVADVDGGTAERTDQGTRTTPDDPSAALRITPADT